MKQEPEKVAAVAAALHIAVYVHRRCLTDYRLRHEPSPFVHYPCLTTCQMPAIWRIRISDTDSHFACHYCSLLYGLDRRDGQTIETAPTATAIMDFLSYFPRDTATKRAAMSTGWFIDRARAFLLALPPCPTPFSGEHACPRCIWIAGTYEGRIAIYELTKAMAALEPKRFGSWPIDEAQNLERNAIALETS